MKTAEQNEVKHTPGPWKRNFAINPDHETVVCVLRTPAGIAKKGINAPAPVSLDPDTIAANARLIAAAPEMLEAISALNGLTIEPCGQCEGTGIREGTDDACHHCGGVGEIVQGHFHPDELRALRAAIAKATRD